ncbi:SusC/RagA family TonB-linked outer membrane protein [Pedobacter metabolipauper]|uniref:TonB-linked SusC/RagA family outer membrane protein n=1 Tax=Pedobacter metabolipauper TaxID=425513 RepID=A0A4R6SYV4_9SPHI|nr:TonB-dependent receptor [Pedobacter metabolipauper]TDQ09892.1 TonB-linked SusC/RagA family outer membrane protein [Pedobacter metabolipauper]
MKTSLQGSLGLVLLLVLSGFSALAQQKLSGKVTDENNQPFPGVIVQQFNTQNKVSTNANGEYTITLTADGGKSLQFNYVGYTAITLPFTATSTTLNASLQPSNSSLDEVVVVGYTTQRRGTITGALTSVNVGEAQKRRVADVAQMLQGQVAGVQITQSTGAPGDPIDIRIRGASIGNNSPLFVIDGVPTTNSSFVNTQDIESMSVLKDASAAAIYGSRAAAGVIIITTKKGSRDKPAFEVNYFNGIQKVANLPTMLNTQQYLAKVEEAWNNSGYTGTNPYTSQKSRTDLANTDWLDELFENGHSQSLQVTASGGSEKVSYMFSGGYYNQDGVVVYDNDKYRRINFRTNINANMTDRLTIGANLQMSQEKRDQLSSRGDAPGIIRHALLRPPVLGVFKDPSDPTYSLEDPFTDLPFYQSNGTFQSSLYEWTQNPVALAYFTDNTLNQFKTFGNAFAEFNVLKDKSLKFKSNVGMEINFNHNKAFFENFGDNDGNAGPLDQGTGRQNRPNGLNEDRGDDYTLTWNNTLNYTNTFGKHAVSGLIGSEFINNTSSSINASRRRFEFDYPAFRYLDLGSSATDLWNGGYASEYSLFSLFATATYVYNNKYMITANMRADASSRFGENNKWGYFPSVSAGWVLSEEDFMKDASWMSYLRLRASTGTLGNQSGIPNYSYLKKYNAEGKIIRYGNPDLKWESTSQQNFGADLGIFKNKFYLSADYFIKTTSDILLGVTLPALVGNVDATIVNAGEVTNKGFELAVSYKDRTAGGFGYNISANMATLKNNVEKLHPNVPSIIGATTRAVPGQPLDVYYGYIFDGIYQNTAEITSHQSGTANPSSVPGDIKFKDLNNDGLINDLDRTYMGSSIPKLTYGFSFSTDYKGFDLSVLLQGVDGVDRYNESKKILDYDTRPFNHTTNVLNSWHGEGTSNTIPRISFTDNGSSRVSSIFIEDASYLRLKNVELGYSFSSILKKTKLGVQNIRLYVSGQNLWTSTNYSGLDPEISDQMDYGTYPQSRAILFGLNVTF